MLSFSINGSSSKPLEASYGTPKYQGVMRQQRGMIGRMPYTLGSSMKLLPSGLAPPESPVIYLLHFDGADGSTAFVNSGSGGQAVTAGGSALSTTSPKFGTASLSVPGGVYAVSQWGASGPLQDSWTAEAWVKANSATLNHAWMSLFEADFIGTQSAIRSQTNGNTKLYNAAGLEIADIPFGTYSAGVWSHRALVRNGAVVTAYKDGVSQGSANIGASVLYDGGTDKYLFFGLGINTDSLDGYIDELRISNGIAQYTANFTPPVAPFPNP